MALPPFLFAVFAKYYDYFTNMQAKFTHSGSIEENIIRLQKHPVIEIYMPGRTTAFQSQNVVPTQYVSVSNPLGGIDDIPGAANIGMVTFFTDPPDPF
jgi:hypothetical protein